MVDRTKLHVTTSWDSFSMAMCSAFDSTKVTPSTPLSFCLATRRLNRDRSSAVTLSVSKLFWQKKKESIGRAVSDFFFPGYISTGTGQGQGRAGQGRPGQGARNVSEKRRCHQAEIIKAGGSRKRVLINGEPSESVSPFHK